MAEADLQQAIEFQVAGLEALHAPFGAELLRRVSAELDGPVGALLAPWREADAPALVGDAVVLRLLAAFHHLAQSGDEPALTRLYPAQQPDTDWDRLWPEIEAAAIRQGERLAAFMEHEPQTNEVRRSACLLGGFLEVAARTGLPLRCFELGASAGLNLSWDRFEYRLGPHGWGGFSPVRIEADWSGPPPALDAPVRVIERAGCDRRPTRLDDPAQRARLEAYIWPDQPDRLERLARAADLAAAEGVFVEQADAAEWLERKVRPTPGAATVVYHSVFWQYPPEATRERIRRRLHTLGAEASASTPLAWLRMEPDPDNIVGPMTVTLQLWPGGEPEVLGWVHPHGAWVRWAGV